jgi:hypothetical protein
MAIGLYGPPNMIDRFNVVEVGVGVGRNAGRLGLVFIFDVCKDCHTPSATPSIGGGRTGRRLGLFSHRRTFRDSNFMGSIRDCCQNSRAVTRIGCGGEHSPAGAHSKEGSGKRVDSGVHSGFGRHRATRRNDVRQGRSGEAGAMELF